MNPELVEHEIVRGEQRVPSAMPPGEQRVVLHNVSWETYEHILHDHVDSSVPRFTFDHGELEILSPSTEHESYSRRIDDVVVGPRTSNCKRSAAVRPGREMSGRTVACTGESTNEAVNLLRTIGRRCRIRVKAVKYFKTGDLVL